MGPLEQEAPLKESGVVFWMWLKAKVSLGHLAMQVWTSREGAVLETNEGRGLKSKPGEQILRKNIKDVFISRSP